MKKEIILKSEIKTRNITKREFHINIFKPPYIEEIEISHKQPYIEVSLESNQPLTNEEKNIIKHLMEKYNITHQKYYHM